MARTRILSEGTAYRPATLAELFCPVDGTVTPHAAGRVERDGDTFGIQVRCRKCRRESVYETDWLPEGYQVYQIHITGEDGPHLPDSMRPVPFLEESFDVVAKSDQDAHERAEFATSLRFTGQLTKYYINGELHLNERF